MSQNDFNISNQGFPSFRADLNSALQALASCSSGSTAPTTTYANMLWMDTANNKLKVRNEGNDAWIDLFDLNQTADTAMLAGVTATVAELNALDGVTTAGTTLIRAADADAQRTALSLGGTISGAPIIRLTSGTFSWPSGVKLARVRIVGGGGAGGGVDGQGAGTAAAGGGGGGARTVEGWIFNPTGSYTVTIGAGGVGVSGGTGGDGGDTTFVSGAFSITAHGGKGGDGRTASAAVSGLVTRGGSRGGGASGTSHIAYEGNDGGDAFHSNGLVTCGASGGNSALGTGGGYGGGSGDNTGDNGQNGAGYGAGGGGAGVQGLTTNFAGGNGTDGICIIEVFT